MDREQVIYLVLDFLREQDFNKALIALEQESQIKLHSYGKELDFFYDLLMEGRFDDAEKFIQPLKSKPDFSFNKVIFEIRKEYFLETLESSDAPNAQQLMEYLQELESLGDKEDFNKLCYCLSLNKISDYPEYANWNISKGRLQCFQNCLQYLGDIYPILDEQPVEQTLMMRLGASQGKSKPKPDARMYKSGGFALSRKKKPEGSRRSIDQNQEYSREFVSEISSITVNNSDLPEKEAQAKRQSARYEEPRSPYLDMSDTPIDHPEEETAFPGIELMSQFHPTRLREIAKLTDMQPIRCSAFSPDGEFCVLGTNSKSLKICSLQNILNGVLYNEQNMGSTLDLALEVKNVHYGSVYCVDWSKNGTQIASGSNDKYIKVIFTPNLQEIQELCGWPAVYANGRYLNTTTVDLPDLHIKTLTGNEATVRSLCYHPQDERILLSGGIVDADIKIWNTEMGQCVQKLTGHSGAVYCISAIGDGQSFVSVGTDRKIRLWDLRAQQCVQTLNGETLTEMNYVAHNNSDMHTRVKSYLTTSDPHDLLAVGHLDGLVSLWDLRGGKLAKKHNFHSMECRSVQFSCDKNWLATASFDNSIGLVDMKRGQTFKIEQHVDRVVSAQWHPYLPIILSTSADKTARVFSLQ